MIRSVDPTAGNVWARVQDQLKVHYGDAIYRTWLKQIEVIGRHGGTVELALPTPFKRDWVDRNYREQIRSCWRRIDDSIRDVAFVVMAPGVAPGGAPGVAASADAGRLPPVPVGPVGQRSAAAIGGDRGLHGTGTHGPDGGELLDGAPDPFAAAAPAIHAGGTAERRASEAGGAMLDTDGLDPRFTFDNFVVGKPNELAYAAARRVAENRAVMFNPLFLYGGVGLGKTHLMHAIAWAIHGVDAERKVLYTSAEKFMYAFIRAVRFRNTDAFKEQFRNVDVLMIDDFQFIGGKDTTQEEFFHTFNALVDRNRQIIISADKSPLDLQGIGERLKSRLAWGLVADIHPTTYELRLGILQNRVDSLGLPVPIEVLEFLADRMTTNVRELEGALNRLVAHASLMGRAITLGAAQEALADLLRASERPITVTDIQKAVVTVFEIKMSDLSAASRARRVTRPRQVAMYLCKRLTQMSLPEIGRHFGNRDHTTVLHAVNRVEQLMCEDVAIRNAVELVERSLKGM